MVRAVRLNEYSSCSEVSAGKQLTVCWRGRKTYLGTGSGKRVTSGKRGKTVGGKPRKVA